MRRREFIKKAAVATGGVVLAPFPDLHHEKLPVGARPSLDLQEIPDLDELAGDWMAGNLIEHTPSLSNFHGSLESSRNILGVQNFTIPPFAQGGELGILSLNGETVAAQEFRWYPYQIQRRSTLENLSILTTVRMPFEQRGFLFAVDITNQGSAPCTATLAGC